MAKRHVCAVPLETARQEWDAFLALVPLFDIGQVEKRLLDRCVQWLKRSPERVHRRDIKLYSGLWFADAGTSDLARAQLIRDQELVQFEGEPGWFAVTNRGPGGRGSVTSRPAVAAVAEAARLCRSEQERES